MLCLLNAQTPVFVACERVCVPWAGPRTAQNGSQWTGIFRTGPCEWREYEGREMMMRRVGDCWPTGSSRDGTAC